MGLADKYTADRFDDRTIEDVGPVRIRHIKTREMLDIGKEQDRKESSLKLIAISVYEGDERAFKNVEQVREIPWSITKLLIDATMDVNKLDKKDAEKNSLTPPSAS